MKTLAIAIKELLINLRDVGGLVMLFLVPIILMLIFGFAMGGAFGEPEYHTDRDTIDNISLTALQLAAHTVLKAVRLLDERLGSQVASDQSPGGGGPSP